MRRKLQWSILYILSSLMLCASSCDLGSSQPLGFSVRTWEEVGISVFGFPLTTFTPNTGISGRMVQALSGASGLVTIFDVRTGLDGISRIENGRAPAIWHLFFTSGPCVGAIQDVEDPTIYPGNERDWYCIHSRSNTFGISPELVDGTNIPQLTIKVQGVDATYGTPQVWIINEQGEINYFAPVDNAASDGTWVTIGGIPQLYTGNYAVLVRNLQQDGSLVTMGGAGLVVYGNDPPPPPPPICVSEHDVCEIYSLLPKSLGQQERTLAAFGN